MKVCPQCGAQFPDSYILCKEDGFPLLDGSSEMPVPGPERALVGDNEPTAVKTPPPVAILAPQPSLAPLSDDLEPAAEETSGACDPYEYDDTTNRIDGDTDAEGPPTALAGQEFNLVLAEASEDLDATRPRAPSSESTAISEPAPEHDSLEPEHDSLEPEQALPSPSAGRVLCPDEGPTEVVDHDEPTSVNPAATEAVAARMGRVPDPAEQPARLPPVQKSEVILQAAVNEEPTTPAPVDEEPTTPAPAAEEPTTPAGFDTVTSTTPILDPAATLMAVEEPTPIIEPAEEPTLLPLEEPPTPVEEPTPYIEPAAGPSPASIMALNPLALAATQPVTNDTEPSPVMHAPPGSESSPAPGPARGLAEAQDRAHSAAVTPQMTQEVDYVFTEQPESAVFAPRRRMLFALVGLAAAALIAAVVVELMTNDDDPDNADNASTAAAAASPDAAPRAGHPDAAAAAVASPDTAASPADAGPLAADAAPSPADAAALAPDSAASPDAAARPAVTPPKKRRIRQRSLRHRRRGKRRGRRRGGRKKRFEGIIDPYAQ